MNHCSHKKPTEEAAREQKPLLDRLNRIEGQIRGVKRMIEEEVYCDDILHQLTATRAALREVQCLLLTSHMQHCVKTQLMDGDEEIVEELIGTVRKMIR